MARQFDTFTLSDCTEETVHCSVYTSEMRKGDMFMRIDLII